MYNNWSLKKPKKLTCNQAIALAKSKFKQEHNYRKMPNGYTAHVLPRYSGGRYVRVIASGKSTEFYFD